MRTSLRAFLHTPVRTTHARLRTIGSDMACKLPHHPSRLLQQSTRSRTTSQMPRSRLYSTKPSPDITSQLGSPDAKLGFRDRLKKLFKEYGYLSVGVYLAFSALDFPFCFLAVRLAGPERIGQLEHQILTSLKTVTEPVWKVIGPVVGPAFEAVRDTTSRIRQGAVKTAGVDLDGSDMSQHAEPPSGSASIWTQLALAYGIHKTLLIFVRVPLTAMFTPPIARALRKRGWKIGSSSH